MLLSHVSLAAPARLLGGSLESDPRGALLACAPPGETVDLQAEIAALREATQAYNAAAESLDQDAVAALYAAHAVAYPPNEPTVRG